MFTCTVLRNGDLELTASAEGREWLIDELPGQCGEWLIWEMLEGYACNGGYTPFNAGDANPFVGLTDAPCIAEDLSVEDNGDRVIHGRFWWFPNYQIIDFADELRDEGRTVFTYAGQG